MAETYWTGAGTANDFDDDANWSGTAPGSGDTAIIADTNSAIDDTSVAAVYSKLRIGQSFTGSIGTNVTGGQALIASGTLDELDFNSRSKAAFSGAVTSVVVSDVNTASDGFAFHGTATDF